MEQSPFPMELLTPDGKISQVNPSWYKLWGVDEVGAAETMEKYNMITDPQLKNLGITDLVKKAFSGEHIILPPIIYDANLTVTDFEIENLVGLKSPWIQSHLYPIKDANGKLEFMVNTYVDITDLKKSEEEIRKSEEHFRNLMEFSPLAIAIFTPDGKLSRVNTAWKELWGLSEEETAQVMANYNFRYDKQIESFGHASLVERGFKGEHIILPPINYEGDRTAADIGLEDIKVQTRNIQTHIYSVKDAKGEIDYVVAINMDITELNKAELEAQGQRESLARIARTTRMGQLTGSIAHELNQPLTGILSNAQAAELLINNNQIEKEEFKNIITDIIEDTKRAGDVIRNLRDMFREHKGEYVPVDVNSIVEDVKKLLHSDFVMKQVELISELVPSIPLVNGNKSQLQQVLVNLIMNGEQAMSRIEQHNRKLHIATAFDEDEVKVWVDDFGSGIDADKIDHIFEPLVTWKPGGTGMGLAIGNSIIVAHGGRMWAENRQEGGARVGFILPVLKKEKKI
jgi:signal transduction histidine kinase